MRCSVCYLECAVLLLVADAASCSTYHMQQQTGATCCKELCSLFVCVVHSNLTCAMRKLPTFDHVIPLSGCSTRVAIEIAGLKKAPLTCDREAIEAAMIQPNTTATCHSPACSFVVTAEATAAVPTPVMTALPISSPRHSLNQTGLCFNLGNL
jgi:hypothetical protein